jgi:hypothetical protein
MVLATFQSSGKTSFGFKPETMELLAARTDAPWDRAMLSVMAAESGQMDMAQALVKNSPPAFQAYWRFAYQGEGQPPSMETRDAVTKALRQGYGAKLLEARILEQSGQSTGGLRQEAKAWVETRTLILATAGAIFGLLLGSGLLFAIFLGLT